MESDSFAPSWSDEQTAEASEKVLRRAKVSRMARQLQSRLALANYKTQMGWQHLDLDTIEPRVDQDLMQKRMQSIQEGKPISSHHMYTEGDSSFRGLRRRPSTDSPNGSSHRKKRARTAAPGIMASNDSFASQASQHTIHGQEDLYDITARHSFRNQNKNRQWKETHRLPQSSPVYHRHHNYDMQNSSGQHFSFMNSPTRSPTMLPQSHFEPQPVFHSSPPRTPPHRTIPPRPRFPTDDDDDLDHAMGNNSNHNGSNNHDSDNGSNGTNNNGNGKPADGEGADLLLYLASSPSPNTMTKAKVSVAPSTPPDKSAALPSSMLKGTGGPNTPSQSLFNIHDFVHITPSPAQGMWGTNGGGRTPLTMTARRRLNFDGLMPPSPMNGSQGSSQGSQGKVTGLGMELGGELVSPTTGL